MVRFGNGFGIEVARRGIGWWAVPRLVLAVALLVLIVMVCVAIYRWLTVGGGAKRAQAAGGSPEELLAQRYARGEIDEAEFRSRLETLRASRVRPST